MSVLPTIGLVFIVIASLTVLLPSFIKGRMNEHEDVSVDRYSSLQTTVKHRTSVKPAFVRSTSLDPGLAHRNPGKRIGSTQGIASRPVTRRPAATTRQALFAPSERPARPVYDFEVREASYKKQPTYSPAPAQMPRTRTGLNKTFSPQLDSLMKDVAKLDQEVADVSNQSGSYTYVSPGADARRRAYGR